MSSRSMPVRRVILAVLVILLVTVASLVAASWAPDLQPQELAERYAPTPSAFIRAAGMDVHVRDEGVRLDEEPVVLLHGTSASLHTWEGWVSALKGTRRVITMDLPGFGLTGPHPEAMYTPEDYAAFVLAVVDALGVRNFVVGGNSLGGEIAWHVALTAPARVTRLILVDAAGYPMTATSIPIGFRLAQTPGLRRAMEYVLPMSVVRQSVENVYGHPDRVTPELVQRYADLTRRAGNRAALAQRFDQMDAGRSAARIRDIKVPTLILWGGQDRLIPPANADAFARDIPGSVKVTWDDLGHVPQEEDPARSVAAVMAWLQGRAP